MKVIAINGSPRKGWNTDILCQKALEGTEQAGAQTELIHLYDYEYKGCVSCFACHLKTTMDQHLCFYKDALTPVLEKCLQADVIIVGTPVYYGGSTGMVRSFLERLLFPLDTYMVDAEGKRIHKRKKTVPTAMIYTMNAGVEWLEKYHIEKKFIANENSLKGVFGYCETLYVCDTYQFTDYSKYTNNIFDANSKAHVRQTQFPIDCQNAFDLGQRLVRMAEESATL